MTNDECLPKPKIIGILDASAESISDIMFPKDDPPEPLYLTVDEARAALEALTVVEITQLRKVARLQALKTSGAYSGDDLLQESFSRTLSGERKWNRKYDALTFFAGRLGVMRSIANAAAKNSRANEYDEYQDEVAYSPLKMREEIGHAAERFTIDAIIAILKDDQLAVDIFFSMLAGHDGNHLRETFQLSQTELEAKLRKIRRRIEKGQKDGKL